MKIRYKTRSASANGNIKIGQVVEVDKKTAELLIKNGCAEKIKEESAPRNDHDISNDDNGFGANKS